MIMGPGEWIALAGVALTGIAGGLGVAYQLGQIAGAVRELTRRVDRIEGKIDRVPKRRAPDHIGLTGDVSSVAP